jgi:hypothetical protein
MAVLPCTTAAVDPADKRQHCNQTSLVSYAACSAAVAAATTRLCLSPVTQLLLLTSSLMPASQGMLLAGLWSRSLGHSVAAVTWCCGQQSKLQMQPMVALEMSGVLYELLTPVTVVLAYLMLAACMSGMPGYSTASASALCVRSYYRVGPYCVLFCSPCMQACHSCCWFAQHGCWRLHR